MGPRSGYSDLAMKATWCQVEVMEIDADSCLACTWTLPLFVIKFPLSMLMSGSHAALLMHLRTHQPLVDFRLLFMGRVLHFRVLKIPSSSLSSVTFEALLQKVKTVGYLMRWCAPSFLRFYFVACHSMNGVIRTIHFHQQQICTNEFPMGTLS